MCINMSHSKDSIAKSYIVEECATFCLRYFHDIETKQNHEEMNYAISSNIINGVLTIFKCIGCTIRSQHLKFLV